MAVGVLIAIMITIVVAVNLIPIIASGEEPGLDPLVDILIYVFVAVMILGAVAWMGFSSEKGDRRGSNEVVAKISSYVRDHRKKILIVTVAVLIVILLQLSTCI